MKIDEISDIWWKLVKLDEINYIWWNLKVIYTNIDVIHYIDEIWWIDDCFCFQNILFKQVKGLFTSFIKCECFQLIVYHKNINTYNLQNFVTYPLSNVLKIVSYEFRKNIFFHFLSKIIKIILLDIVSLQNSP
jgi:hypothetical protein